MLQVHIAKQTDKTGEQSCLLITALVSTSTSGIMRNRSRSRSSFSTQAKMFRSAAQGLLTPSAQEEAQANTTQEHHKATVYISEQLLQQEGNRI